MPYVPQTLDERIATAEAAGEWSTVNALNGEKLAELSGRDIAANARAYGDTPAATTQPRVASPPLDEQIANASAERDWARLNAINAQMLAVLTTKADAEALEMSAVGEQMVQDRSFRLHVELDPSNPEHAAAIADADKAKTAAQLLDVYERQRAGDRWREAHVLARLLP